MSADAKLEVVAATSPPVGIPKNEVQAPLSSVHTTNLPGILKQLGCSIALTTYQAGHLVLIRAEGDKVNTHFRMFHKPMGMALAPNRLALGTSQQIWDFRNIHALLPRLEPKGVHDACFLPRSTHYTGDIQIHEMVFQGSELWFVNTVFSCICTYDFEHSFVPRWRPKFVNVLAPGDRCHLNGIGLADGKPKWVSALGTTSELGGWRANKKRGGVIMDIESSEIVCPGLSMPHSPRWYAGRLWVLESGTGSLGMVDLDSGRYEPICFLPGFTRGLDFVGNLAFVGLSQVRETAIFSGLPITERLKPEERICGLAVVDIRTGQQVAFLKFTDAVQEVFAISVVRGALFPELFSETSDLTASSFVLPDEALKQIPREFLRPRHEEESQDPSGNPPSASKNA